MKALFSELLPPLSSEEFAALKADIEADGGVPREKVIVDEDGNVLDGRHRLRICPKAPTRVVRGLTPAEKEAFVFRCNFVRRNLSPDQKVDAQREMKRTACKLKEENNDKWTDAKIATALGVARRTVSDWLSKSSRNGGAANGNKKRRKSRVKIDASEWPVIAARVAAGETQAQVAADYGVKQSQVSKICKAEAKKAAEEKAHAEAAAKSPGDCGIHHGDFRESGKVVEDSSVDLIFTDPPYDEKSIPLYGELARFAARVLRPGGWLLAYEGKANLPRSLAAMAVDGLAYGWTFCALHSGGDARFRNLKVHTGWKPILGFYRPPLKATWDWFRDVVSGGREKDKHPWQQAESEARHFIEVLSKKGGIVCDPFAGSGTTLAAAKAAGRRWIGFEVDAKHVATARKRLS